MEFSCLTLSLRMLRAVFSRMASIREDTSGSLGGEGGEGGHLRKSGRRRGGGRRRMRRVFNIVYFKNKKVSE